MREIGFGTLAINRPDGPLISHIPFLLNEAGAEVEAHLVRSNPIARTLRAGPVQATIAVTSEEGYISPDWYVDDGVLVPDQVPTWNYVAVHVHGQLRLLDQDALHAILSRLSADHEARLSPKKPWTSDKMDQQVYQKMQRQIVPIAMEVERIDSTWKLSQNKSDAVRHATADAVEARGNGQLATLMRSANG